MRRIKTRCISKNYFAEVELTLNLFPEKSEWYSKRNINYSTITNKSVRVPFRYFELSKHISSENLLVTGWNNQLFTFEKLYFTTGGVRTLIALHHGRKMKSESLASCRCRVNISSGSEIAWINVECNGDSLFAVLRDSCYSSVTNLLLEGNWRDSERIETAALPKNLFIRLAAVTLTADGRVNNIIFASYLAGNRPLICKRITVTATF